MKPNGVPWWTVWETVCKAHRPTYELCAICAPSHTSFLRNPSAMLDSIAHVFSIITICDNVLSQTVQEPLRTHTSAVDRLWFLVYHRCLRQEWCMLFIWDPTRFLENLQLGLYFTLGTVYSDLSCAIMWYHKRFQKPYAHVVALQIVCDLLCITDGSATINVCFLMWIAHTHLVETCAEQLPG